MMKSWGKLILGAVLLSLCLGCFRVETLIKLDPSGSGKLFIRLLLSESLQQNDKLAQNAKEFAAKLGEGVTFIGTKEIATKGWKGLQSEYHFTDINNLTLGHGIGSLGQDTTDTPTADTAEEGSTPSTTTELDLAFLSGEKDGPWRFRYTQGDTNELVAFHSAPQTDELDADDPFAAAGVELSNAPAASFSNAIAVAILRPMLVGAQASLTVHVDGTIVDSDAPHQPQQDAVQLLKLDLSKFAESKQFEKAVIESWSLDRLVQEKVPGISAPRRDQTVTVRFR